MLEFEVNRLYEKISGIPASHIIFMLPPATEGFYDTVKYSVEIKKHKKAPRQ